MKVGVLTISDRSASGIRADLGGPAVTLWLQQYGAKVSCTGIVPDEVELIAAKLSEWADDLCLDLILTTGGTGVSPRDVTPEATMQVIDRLIPGFGEVMRAESLKITPMAVLSRAIAGVKKQTLIINLPGSPKGAIENLAVIWAAIPHAIDKIHGDPTDCPTFTVPKLI